ncbi:5'/3'-nucleotidase SurE [Gordonia caeni]|uniref:5'-nucleotidase n=1 Tax=Gordonia caeni TaxID=1007097 RepID=A0ABP7NND4_9ACTN
MRILVTNDDGVDAPGLLAVAQALTAAGFTLDVVAPSADYSGSGSGLGSIQHGRRVGCRELSLPGLARPAVAVDAPPVFAVLAAMTGLFGPRPDLVISGINDGFNTGRMLMTSSTVSAAQAAGALGARGLAVSAGFAPAGRVDTAAHVAVHATRWMVEHSAARTVLNVNVPDSDLEDLRGVRACGLAPRGLMGLKLSRSDEAITLERFENSEGLGLGTDADLIRQGYVTLSLVPATAAGAPDDRADPAAAIEAELHAAPATAR